MTETPTPPIQPALTPEQWAIQPNKYGQRHYWFDMDGNLGTVFVLLCDGIISVNWDGAVYDSEAQKLSNESRHAVAALCLHEQPFGFTHEDVQNLRDAEAIFDSEGMGPDLSGLIARITALLPPHP